MSVVKNITDPRSAAAWPPVANRAGLSRRSRRLFAAMLIATSGLVSACAENNDAIVTGTVSNDYRTRHPIVVAQSEITEDIVVPFDAASLSPRDRGVAVDFAKRFKRSGTKSMAVMIPSGSRNEAAAKRIALQVTRVLQKTGVDERQIYIHHYKAAGLGDAATLRLVYGDLKASVPSECGQWGTNLVDNTQNDNYYNFGCATQKNLAAIVANPADLLGPRGETPIDSTRRTNVISDWQENGNRPLPILFGY